MKSPMNPLSVLGAVAVAGAMGLAAVTLAAPEGEPNTRLLDPAKEQPGLKVGEHAPSLTLTDSNGKHVTLSELYASKAPVVVTFYRGGWCPFCNRALMSWAEKMDELTSAGGTFVAISPETAQHAIETEKKVKGDWITLVDADGAAMRAFRVGFHVDGRTEKRYRGFGINLDTHNANGKWELPAPSTLIIDRDGVVRWAFNDWDYKKRADPDEVIAEVRKLTHSGS